MSIAPRWQPLVFVALASLALAAFAAYDLYRERDNEVVQAKANTANLARLLEAHTRQSLRRAEALLGIAAARIARAATPAGAEDTALQDDLRALLPADGLVTGLVWLAADGKLLASTLPQAAQAGTSALLQDWQARRQAEPAARIILGRQQAVRDAVWQMPVGMPLPPGQAGAGGQGAVLALLDTGALQAVLDSVNTGRNGFVTLFLRDGWIVSTAPRKEALFAKSWFDSPMFKVHLPQSPVGTVQQVVVRDNTERIYSYRALDDYPLVVSSGISLTDALADWRTRILWDTLLLLAVCGALALAAAGMYRSTARREAAEASAAAQAHQAQALVATARDEAQRSERFLRNITDNLPMRIAYIDRELRYRFVNRSQAERLGLPREAILGRKRSELNQSPLPDAVGQAVAATLAGQPQQMLETDEVNGEQRMLKGVLVPDVGADGQVLGFYVGTTDVTALMAQQQQLSRALAERETLLREVYHRVKNNLQVIQSLLNLQRRALPEGPARSALRDSVQRVQAMSLVHEKLYQTGNLEAIQLPDYTADLLRHLGEAADAGRCGITLRARIDPIDAPLQDAVPYGLLVTELVMNSLKHAFPGGRGGGIEVRLLRTAQGAQLRVQDDGIGLPAGFDLGAPGASMGLQLATSLAQQLGGELRVDSSGGAAGASFSALLTRLNPPSPDLPAAPA